MDDSETVKYSYPVLGLQDAFEPFNCDQEFLVCPASASRLPLQDQPCIAWSFSVHGSDRAGLRYVTLLTQACITSLKEFIAIPYVCRALQLKDIDGKCQHEEDQVSPSTEHLLITDACPGL